MCCVIHSKGTGWRRLRAVDVGRVAEEYGEIPLERK